MNSIALNLIVESKGRPPKWLPAFLKPALTWTIRRSVVQTIPAPGIEGQDIIPLPFGAALVVSWDADGIDIAATSNGLTAKLVSYHVPEGPMKVDSGRIGGFRVWGDIHLV